METVKLTNNEKSVLVSIVANAKQVGDNGVEFILEDVANTTGKSIRSISATVGSLAKKGMLLTANGESYFDGVVTEAGLHEVEESDKVNQEVNNNKNQDNMEDKNFDAPAMDERIIKLNELKSVKMAALSKSKRPAAKEAKGLAAYVLDKWDNQYELESLLENADEAAVTELGKSVLDIAQNRRNELNAIKIENAHKEAEARLKETASKKETKKADKTAAEKASKTARKVGDVHPKHPTWVWTEYAEGKFDWRTNPADKKQGQRTDKAATSEMKSEPKKAAVSKKAVAKETNKKVAKGGKVEKEAPKELTIDEFVALPSKSARGNKKPSEAQKEALKLVMKGYRVTADHKFFENAEGDKKACNWDSVVAMLKRYGMEYIPVGLVK